MPLSRRKSSEKTGNLRLQKREVTPPNKGGKTQSSDETSQK